MENRNQDLTYTQIIVKYIVVFIKERKGTDIYEFSKKSFKPDN